MTATYENIATTTLGSNQTSVTFNSFSGYTDLILVMNLRDTASGTQTYPFVRFNSDTGTNYSFTRVQGTGTQASSGRASNQNKLELTEAAGAGTAANVFSPTIVQIQNYANTTTNKTCLVRINNETSGGGIAVGALVGLWRSTSAITSIEITGQTSLATGSSFTLYGIKAE
jgi:hypothetical protein